MFRFMLHRNVAGKLGMFNLHYSSRLYHRHTSTLHFISHLILLVAVEFYILCYRGVWTYFSSIMIISLKWLCYMMFDYFLILKGQGHHVWIIR